MRDIHVALFRFHLPVVVAIGRGMFDVQELRPRWTVVHSSGEQRALVESGDALLAHTAVDNVAGWHSSETPWAVLRVVDVGLPHQLVANPPRAVLADLRGSRIAVDSARSGFVTLLRSELARAGLEGAVEFVEVGALQRRLMALEAAEVDACLLGAEQLALALAAGANVITSLNALFPEYPGLVVSGVATSAERHRDLLRRYVAVLAESSSWCFEPARMSEVIDIVADVLELAPAQAVAWYEAEYERWSGNVGPAADEKSILERAWRATGRIGADQPMPTGWFRPDLLSNSAAADAAPDAISS